MGDLVLGEGDAEVLENNGGKGTAELYQTPS